MIRRPTISTLFPYTTLFRSASNRAHRLSIRSARSAGPESVGRSLLRSSGKVRPAVQLPVALVLQRSEEHTSELQSHSDLVCHLLLEKKNSMGRHAVIPYCSR